MKRIARLFRKLFHRSSSSDGWTTGLIETVKPEIDWTTPQAPLRQRDLARPAPQGEARRQIHKGPGPDWRAERYSDADLR